MLIPQETRDWLLAAPEPYIRYQALKFFDPAAADPALLDDDPFIQENLLAVSAWPDAVLTRHDKPDLFMHRLAMLADLGVTERTAGARPVVDSLLANIEPDGSLRINIMIPTVFGGSGEVSKEWLICDFPVTVYALLRMGVCDTRLEQATTRLIELAGAEYFSCCGSIPKFKGPGRRGGMCPYANLLVARALSVTPEDRSSSAAQLAAHAVLGHWTDRKTAKPFLFGMGTDFLKLKFPMIWYNLLHVLYALRPIDGVSEDSRYVEMTGHLRGKLDAMGRATAESMYMIYKAQEWSNKKKPSRLLTVLIHRLLFIPFC